LPETLTRGKSPNDISTGNKTVDDAVDEAFGGKTVLGYLLEEAKKGNFFSVGRAVSSAYKNKKSPGQPTGLEGEVSQELAYHAQQRGTAPATAFRVPWRYPTEQRSLTTQTGAGSITSQIQSPTDVLRSKMVCSRLGAQLLNLPGSGPQGKVRIPVRTGGSTALWLVEGGAAAASNSVTVATDLSPYTVSATALITRMMVTDLGQPGFVDFTLEEMMTSCAVALDTAVIGGSGFNQPFGLASNAGITAVKPVGDTGTGGTIAYSVLEQMESLVGQQNGDSAAFCRPGWVTSPLGRSQLRNTDVSGTAGSTGRYGWQAKQHVIDGAVLTLESVLGWQAFSTNAMPSGLSQGGGTANLTGLLFGNWADVLINCWDSFAIRVNPFTQSSQGVVTASVFLDCASLLRRAASFTSCSGWAAS
jgi:HK97 family phage major capsid protein